MNENETPVESFETVFARLEAIVKKMENDNPDLESALKAFEEGKAAADRCRAMLEQAELKLKNLQETDAE